MKVFAGNLIRADIKILRNDIVGDVIKRLRRSFPDSGFQLTNQLLDLQEDQNLADVLDDYDDLTVFKQKEKKEKKNDDEKDNHFFVVIQSSLTKRPIFLPPAIVSKLDLRKLAYKERIAVFW